MARLSQPHDLKLLAKRAAFVVLFCGLASIGLIVRLLHDRAPQAGTANIARSTYVTYRGLVIPASGKVLIPTMSGRGSKQTHTFSTDGGWNVYWNFTSANAQAGDKFNITVYNADGQKNPGDKPLALVSQESGYGTLQYDSKGKQYLVIDTPDWFTWQVTVKSR